MKEAYFNNDFEYYFSNEFGKMIHHNFPNILKNCALVILKPECLLTNRINVALRILKEYNFEPIYFKIKILSQQQVFSLWKYGWNEASLARILMNCIVMDFSPCVIIVLKNNLDSLKDPCEFLNLHKGKSCISKSDHVSIRYRLGAVNNFLNFIHISDSFDDMVRELALLYTYDEIIALFEALKNNITISMNCIQEEAMPYINNYVFSDPITLFKEYIISLSNKSTNRNIMEELHKAFEKKSISNELFISLISNNLIDWDWHSIILFSSFIETIDEHKTTLYRD